MLTSISAGPPEIIGNEDFLFKIKNLYHKKRIEKINDFNWRN